MTSLTDAHVVPGRALAPRHIVRIVAGGASQRAGRFLKTGRFAQPVGLMGDFELVVMTGPLRVVEMQHVAGQRLARTVGKNPAVVSRDGIRKAEAGRFEMTLHADFQTPLGIQARRVDDRASYRFYCRILRLGGLSVAASRSVAALAVNPFPDLSAEDRLHPTGIGTRCDGRIAVVAKHAAERDPASKILMIRTVVARIHSPVPPFFAVPGDRKFHDLPILRSVEVGSSVIARSDYEVNLFLDDVSLLAVEIGLMPALIVFSIPLNHRVMTIRSRMIEGFPITLDGVGRTRSRQ